MIDVTELLFDPDFAVHFTVIRTTGQWNKGRFELNPPEEIQMFHPVQPASAEDLEQIPEGDRRKGMMKFFCVQPKEFHLTRSDADLQESDEGGISDVIKYRGKRYKLVQVMPWDSHGWQRAFGYLMEE